MPAAIEIEALGADRVDELRPLWLQVLHAHHQAVAPELAPYVSDDESWVERRALYLEALEGDGFALLARDARGVLGYAMVAVHRGRPNTWSDTWRVSDVVAEVETLLVVPEARGAGVGTRLLDRVDEELEQRGIEDLVIGVVPGNVAATRLYERRGLRPTFTYLTRFAGRTGS